MKLKVGTTYKARNGDKVTITYHDGDDIFPFDADNGQSYTPSGTIWTNGETSYDLIAEWRDEPTVREWVGWNGGECPVHPDTVVQTFHLATGSPKTNSDYYKASHQDWDHVIAYRIITPYVEPTKPREFWLYRDGDNEFSVKDEKPYFVWNEVIHVREVLDD